jgi:hypothetical protein
MHSVYRLRSVVRYNLGMRRIGQFTLNDLFLWLTWAAIAFAMAAIVTRYWAYREELGRPLIVFDGSDTIPSTRP